MRFRDVHRGAVYVYRPGPHGLRDGGPDAAWVPVVVVDFDDRARRDVAWVRTGRGYCDLCDDDHDEYDWRPVGPAQRHVVVDAVSVDALLDDVDRGGHVARYLDVRYPSRLDYWPTAAWRGARPGADRRRAPGRLLSIRRSGSGRAVVCAAALAVPWDRFVADALATIDRELAEARAAEHDRWMTVVSGYVDRYGVMPDQIADRTDGIWLSNAAAETILSATAAVP